MKFLVVDDHPVVRNALVAELGTEHQYLLAASLEEALANAEKHSDIDLIIYDLNLPDSHGMESLLRLRVAAQSIPVLVFSACTNKKEIEQALKLGACGFVPKTTATGGLADAVETVLKGKTYVPKEIFGWKTKSPVGPRTKDNFVCQLTTSERDILPLVVEGLSNKAIAKLLGRSEHTVRVHVRNILKKVNVENRTQLASKWFSVQHP